MTEMLQALDVYSSRMEIPFDVAAYCRGHKLSVEAVNYARAIRRLNEADAFVLEAEKLAEAEKINTKAALTAIRKKMERDPL